MRVLARFCYNESKFPEMDLPDSIRGQVVDTRFFDFYMDLAKVSLYTRDFYVLDASSLNWKLPHSIDVLSFRDPPDRDGLKSIFSKILSSDNELFPESVVYKDWRYFSLIKEILDEVNPKKKDEILFNRRLVFS